MSAAGPLVQIADLKTGYKTGNGKSRAIGGCFNLQVFPGQLICLLGPNGCGKSTLLRTLSGLQLPLSGEVLVKGKEIGSYRFSELARLISVVLTENVRSSGLDVYSLIALGRYPYSGWTGQLTPADNTAIGLALSRTGTVDLTGRSIDTLSDGEYQKVMLARALAQDTSLILLDEPTAHLDLPSRIQLIRMLHRLAGETGKAIMLSTHELDLALQAADQVWLMDAMGQIQSGIPEDLVLNGALQRVFEKQDIIFDDSSGTFRFAIPGTRKISVQGEGTGWNWTKKALIRKGYVICDPQETTVHLAVTGEGQTLSWMVEKDGLISTYRRLADLLNAEMTGSA